MRAHLPPAPAIAARPERRGSPGPTLSGIVTWIAERWHGLRMRDALILTLPFLLLFGYLVAASAYDYYRYIQFDDYWSHAASVDRFFTARLETAFHTVRALETEHKLDPEATDAGIVRLTVPQATWSVMNDPQASWGQWFKGALVEDNDITQVDLRKRGDNSVHWLTPKRSFTMKTPVNSLFKGYQTVGFSAKDVLSAFVANRLAREVGLFAATTEVTPVFVNNRFFGLFRLNEVVDENFLREQLRLPGNIFRGDVAERGEYFKNQNRNLFENPYIWDRAARSERPNASPIAGLQALLEGSNAGTLEAHQRLMSLVDRRQVVGLAAYLLVVGDPWHMDAVHNEFWYEDPWSMLLSPIPWDIRLLDLTRPPPSPGRANEFFREALRDPFLVDDILREVNRLLDQEHVVELGERLAQTRYNRYRPYFEYDQLRGGMIPDLGNPAAISHVLRDNEKVLRGWLSDARIAFHAEPAGGNTLLDFETQGYAGNDLTALAVVGSVARTARLYADRNDNGVLDRDDSLVAGRWSMSGDTLRFLPARPEPLFAGWDAHHVGITPERQHYRFFLTGVGAHASGGLAIVPELKNRVTGTPTVAGELKSGQLLTPPASWHPWRFAVSRSVTHRFSGDVHLTETLEIPPGDTVIVSASTTFKLDPDVSILVRGHFEAHGEENKPVTFEQAVPGKPWGTIALQGPGADSSRLTWTRFYGGGGALLHEVEYTGSVSLHYVNGVQYDHLEIAHNVRSDDAFHAYHSSFSMRNCHFAETNADALDLDYASGEISHCRIDHAGNDAFDLMTSDPWIHDNYITGSDDKGISIGESSNPFVFNNYITHCLRGIEVKDGSEPLILNNTLVANNIGLRQRLKNVRYWHGGWGKIINTRIVGNTVDLQSDRNSRITAWGSIIGRDTFPVTQSDLLPWIYREKGIVPDSIHSGVLTSWRPVPPHSPLVSTRFEDDFEENSDGWIALGSAAHLEKRNRNLIVSLRNWSGGLSQRSGEGIIARAVDWNLSAAGGNSLVVFELLGRDVVGGRIILESDRGPVARDFHSANIPLRYQYVVLDLPPAHYTGIRIAASPAPGMRKTNPRTGLVDVESARLEIHGLRLYSLLSSLPPHSAGPVAAAGASAQGAQP